MAIGAKAFTRAEDTSFVDYELIYNDRLIGTVTFKRWGRNSHRRVYNLYVEPQYRRQGYGNFFMNKFIEYFRAQGITTITGHVDKVNEAATDFYAALGFDMETAESNPAKWFISMDLE